MSNSEKMNQLREKLLDAALAGSPEDARLYAEALGMMPQEDTGGAKVGSNAAPTMSDADAAALNSAKAMLAKLGHKDVTDETAAAFRDWKPEDWATWKRLKTTPLGWGTYGLFTGQGLPSFTETLEALKLVPLSKDEIARAMGFYMPPRRMSIGWNEPLATVKELRDYVKASSMANTFLAQTGVNVADSDRSQIVNWLVKNNYEGSVTAWVRAHRDAPAGRVARAHAVWVECPRSDDSFVAEFRWNENADLESIRLPDTISASALSEFACARDGLAFKEATGKSPESAAPVEIVVWINSANLYRDFVEWERMSRSKPSLSAATPAHWFVSDAPVTLKPGVHEVVSDGGLSLYTLMVGEVGSFGRQGRGPIGLRSDIDRSIVIAHVDEAKWTLYPIGGKQARGRVFDSIVSAYAHLDSTEPEKPAPKPADWLNPAEVQPLGQPSFKGARSTVETSPDLAPPPVEIFHVEATHWFVPASTVHAEPGNRVTHPGSEAAFYVLASDRGTSRDPVPLRRDPSSRGAVPLGDGWRLYRPGVSYAGSVHASLKDAPAPKKARHGLLDINVAGQSTLLIVESADGIPTSVKVHGFQPGSVLKTMLSVVSMCFKHGVTTLYGAGSFRGAEIHSALVTITAFMRGEPLHGLTEADRTSFLRMATTIEWPRAYTIPTYKVLASI